MSIKFSSALILGVSIYLGTEVLIGLNRPLIADRWVSESIKINDNGKRYTPDATFEMDLFSKGWLTDVQFDRHGYAVRYQFDGEDKDIGKFMGFPEAAYTKNKYGARLLNDGLCEINTFRRRPGNNGDITIFSRDDCPAFEARHRVGDGLVYFTRNGNREMEVILKRKSRLNPLARFITNWNRHNYLGNAEEFMRKKPI